jgi:hypothetical protein
MGPAASKPAFDGNFVARRNNWEASWAQGNKAAQDKYVSSVQRFQLNKVPVVQITPKRYNKANDGKIAMYIHGGAYVLGRPDYMLPNYAPVSFVLGKRKTEDHRSKAAGRLLFVLQGFIGLRLPA